MASKNPNKPSRVRKGKKRTADSQSQSQLPPPSTDKSPSSLETRLETAMGDALWKWICEYERKGHPNEQDLFNYSIAKKAGIHLQIFDPLPDGETRDPTWVRYYHVDIHRRLHGQEPLRIYSDPDAPENQLAAAGKAAGLWSDHPETHPGAFCPDCGRHCGCGPAF